MNNCELFLKNRQGQLSFFMGLNWLFVFICDFFAKLFTSKHRLIFFSFFLFLCFNCGNSESFFYLSELNDGRNQSNQKVINSLNKNFHLNNFKKFSGSTNTFYS